MTPHAGMLRRRERFIADVDASAIFCWPRHQLSLPASRRHRQLTRDDDDFASLCLRFRQPRFSAAILVIFIGKHYRR